MTRVLVAARSAVVRAGLETILGARPGIEVVGSSYTQADLHAAIERFQPDVVLLEMDRGSPTDGALPASLPAAGPPAHVILVDGPAAEWVADTLRAGGGAVLPRGAQPEEIVAAVEAVATGLVVLHHDSTSALLPLLSGAIRPVATAGRETLTPREIEVLGMLAEGEGNKQIARRLGISEHTVKFHVSSILAKLGAATRTEAVTLGLRGGLIMV